MGRRKDWTDSEKMEFLLRKIDERTSFGKQAGKVIRSWEENNDSSKLSLLVGLVMETDIEKLEELDKLQEEFYVRNQKGRCVCGQPFSKECIVYNFKKKTAAQKQIVGTISTGKSLYTKDHIAAGSTCMNRIPTLLEEIRLPGLKKKRGKEKDIEDKLQDIIKKLSPDVREKLEKQGINTEILKKVLELEHVHELLEEDESGVKFDLDKKTSTSTYNWFKGLKESALRENVKEDHLEDLLDIWHKLNNAVHLVTRDELAEIMVYSHEFRLRETDVLLAGVIQDLFYLSREGELNIDKHFVLPQTKYRDRKKLRKRTVRDVLNQKYVTRIEAMGIHNHFKDIVERRIEINRETAKRYGVGRTWDYIVKEIEPWFERAKEELHVDYIIWGKVMREHVFTKDDYLTIKYFLKRSRIGRGSQRENYLRNHHIAHFNRVAPKIIKIGRKLRYARKLKRQGAKVNRYDILRQDFFLKEDFIEPFTEYTGLKEIQYDEFLDLVRHTGFIEHKNYQEFRRKLLSADKIKLVPKELIKITGKNKITPFKRYYGMLKKKGIPKVDKEVLKKAEHIKNLHDSGLFSSIYGLSINKLSSKWDKTLEEKVKIAYRAVKDIKVPEKSIREDIEKLNQDERNVIKISDREVGITGFYAYKASKKASKDIRYYDVQMIQEIGKEQEELVSMTRKTLQKLVRIADDRLENGFYGLNKYEKERLEDTANSYHASQEVIDKIEEKYTSLEKEAEELVRIDKRRAQIKKAWPIENISYEFIRSHEKLTKFLVGIPGLEEHLCEKYSEFDIERDVVNAKAQWDKGGDVEDKYFDALKKFDVRKQEATKEIYEKTWETSVVIRKGLNEDANEFFKDHLLDEFLKDEDIKQVGKGLGAQTRDGQRKIEKPGQKSVYYWTFNEKFDKYNIERTLQGLDKVVAGKKERFEISKTMNTRFESDVKKGRIKENDVEKYRAALQNMEKIVNDKIFEVYSLEYQMNPPPEPYVPPPSSTAVGRLRSYPRRSSGRRFRGRRRGW